MSEFANALEAYIQGQLDAHMGEALNELGNAYAAAVVDAEPERTGALKRSTKWVPISATEGAVQMLGYGLIVNDGHAVRYKLKNSPRMVRSLKAGRVVRTTSGETRVPANPFLERAWASSSVQAVLNRFPDLLFSRG